MERISLKAYLAQPWRAEGRNLVAPITMMVMGVHHGSHGPILHLKETLEASVARWNRIPVVVNHPEDQDGSYVSVKETPEAVIGHVRGARMDGTKLKAEAVITSQDPEVRALVQTVKEVSVAVFSEDIASEGVWNGEMYYHIAQNHRPDHLALLPEAVGACSWKDGCGIRANVNLKGEAMHLKDCNTCQDPACSERELLLPVTFTTQKKPKPDLEVLRKQWEGSDCLPPGHINALLYEAKAEDDGGEEKLLPGGMVQ